MNGITIINSTDLYGVSGWQILLALCPLILFAIVFFVRLYKAFKKGTASEQARGVISLEHWSPKECLTILIGGVLAVILAVYFNYYKPADYLETQYVIKIEDSVSFNDVYNKYEIVEEKEDTFIVRERD
jgi:Na+/H+ antiporter NhaC